MSDYGEAPEGETLRQFCFRMGWELDEEADDGF